MEQHEFIKQILIYFLINRSENEHISYDKDNEELVVPEIRISCPREQYQKLENKIKEDGIKI